MIRDAHAQTAGLGRTLGDDSSIQRGWLNPDHQLFGQVTSQARQSQPYDHHVRCLTNTEEPSYEARSSSMCHQRGSSARLR
jgi:hypothetical protein